MKTDLIIEKIENGIATLRDKTGRMINWPSDLLPSVAKEKEQIAFNIGENENLAKDILNEILSPE